MNQLSSCGNWNIVQEGRGGNHQVTSTFFIYTADRIFRSPIIPLAHRASLRLAVTLIRYGWRIDFLPIEFQLADTFLANCSSIIAGKIAPSSSQSESKRFYPNLYLLENQYFSTSRRAAISIPGSIARVCSRVVAVTGSRIHNILVMYREKAGIGISHLFLSGRAHFPGCGNTLVTWSLVMIVHKLALLILAAAVKIAIVHIPINSYISRVVQNGSGLQNEEDLMTVITHSDLRVRMSTAVASEEREAEVDQLVESYREETGAGPVEEWDTVDLFMFHDRFGFAL